MRSSRVLRSSGFVLLTISLLPLSIIGLCLNYIYIFLFPTYKLRRQLQRTPDFAARTILITRPSTPQGLRLARAFHETGHQVIGAEHRPGRLFGYAFFSRAFDRFYSLPSDQYGESVDDYIEDLRYVIRKESIDLWISCASVESVAIEAEACRIIEQNTKCVCFSMRTADIPYLENRQAFLTHLSEQGLKTPETYRVTSRGEIHNVLNKTKGGKKYLLQSFVETGVQANSARTVLPSRTLSQTYNTVSRLSVTQAMPWRLEQDLNHLPRYSTFAVVVEGYVKTFAVCSQLHPGCHKLLEPRAALTVSMLRYVENFAAKQGKAFTAHFGMDFCVDEQVTDSNIIQAVLPMKIVTNIPGATQMYHSLGGSIMLSQAYLAALTTENAGPSKITVRPTAAVVQQQTKNLDTTVANPSAPGVFNVRQDLFNLCLKPVLDKLAGRTTSIPILPSLAAFVGHLLFWQEDTFDARDPLPFWYAHQVQIPLQLFSLGIAHQNSLSPQTKYSHCS